MTNRCDYLLVYIGFLQEDKEVHLKIQLLQINQNKNLNTYRRNIVRLISIPGQGT
jgi:hypothetical protein